MASRLNKTQIRDLLATLGVGLTGQYWNRSGRKLIGGLLGSVAGGMAVHWRAARPGSPSRLPRLMRSVSRARYYAGGRVMSAGTC